jgi:hypothetical protein
VSWRDVQGEIIVSDRGLDYYFSVKKKLSLKNARLFFNFDPPVTEEDPVVSGMRLTSK